MAATDGANPASTGLRWTLWVAHPPERAEKQAANHKNCSEAKASLQRRAELRRKLCTAMYRAGRDGMRGEITYRLQTVSHQTIACAWAVKTGTVGWDDKRVTEVERSQNMCYAG